MKDVNTVWNDPVLSFTLSVLCRLTYNPKTKALAVEPTANQDNPLSSGLGYSGNTPLLVSTSPCVKSVEQSMLKGHIWEAPSICCILEQLPMVRRKRACKLRID